MQLGYFDAPSGYLAEIGVGMIQSLCEFAPKTLRTIGFRRASPSSRRVVVPTRINSVLYHDDLVSGKVNVHACFPALLAF